jgi:plasmid replication initiation protein
MRGDFMVELEKSKDILVYQSNKLIEASYRLRIGQQKFLRLMASRINKNDEDFKEYNFRIADVMELFETKSQKSYTEITKQLRELMGNVLTFKIGKGTTLVPFLIFAQQNEGSGVIKVQYHPFLKPMYLSLSKENPFTVYKLSNALKLRSTYALRFYELLKQYQKIGYRVLKIEDIRTMFELQPTEYKRYNDFKRKIIFQAQKEINEKTDISFEFEEIKTGRKITSCKFNIKTNKTRVENEIAATKVDETPKENYIENVKSIIKIVIDKEITDKSANEIYKCATKHKKYGNNPLELINEVAEYSKTQSIKGFVGWFKSTVTGYEKPIETSKRTAFNDYEQRSYDYNDLEKKLLGWNE